jgi:hypothetical protein
MVGLIQRIITMEQFGVFHVLMARLTPWHRKESVLAKYQIGLSFLSFSR